VGKQGFPTPLPVGGFAGRSPRAGGWGTGVPHSPAPGRVWKGAARAPGDGEPGVPHAPTRWEGLEGRSPPKKDVHPVGARRSRMDG